MALLDTLSELVDDLAEASAEADYQRAKGEDLKANAEATIGRGIIAAERVSATADLAKNLLALAEKSPKGGVSTVGLAFEVGRFLLKP